MKLVCHSHFFIQARRMPGRPGHPGAHAPQLVGQAPRTVHALVRVLAAPRVLDRRHKHRTAPLVG